MTTSVHTLGNFLKQGTVNYQFDLEIHNLIHTNLQYLIRNLYLTYNNVLANGSKIQHRSPLDVSVTNTRITSITFLSISRAQRYILNVINTTPWLTRVHAIYPLKLVN